MNKKRVEFKKVWSKVLLSILLIALFLPMTMAGANSTLTNPIVAAADPSVVYLDGLYYYVRGIGNKIEVFKSPSLANLEKGTPATVFTTPTSGDHCADVWAPELIWNGDYGRWYIYYAATTCDGNNANRRSFVLESNSTDAQGSYTDKGRIFVSGADYWAIDGTVLNKNGALYFVWSGWPGTTEWPQNLYIAPMSNPWTINGGRVRISTPEYSWENSVAPVNEGPEVIQRNGKIFIVYSANASWTDEYKLGLLSMDYGADPLVASNWTKRSTPIFEKSIGDQVFGPGHNFFIKSPNGYEDWLVYHGTEKSGQGWYDRIVRAQPFTWWGDGTPNLGNPAAPIVDLARPDGDPIRYEAEYATINKATIVNHGAASNLKKVGYIDFADSYVQFNVNVPDAGKYRIFVRYGNGMGTTATHNVSVNGGTSSPIYYGSYGWDNWKWQTIDVNLNAGNNTIRFTKGTSYAELDSIEVLRLTRYEAENATLSNVAVLDNTGASNGKRVGWITNSDSYVQFNVNVPTTGNYIMTVRYSNGYGSDSTHNVSVNGGASTSLTYQSQGWNYYNFVTMNVNLNAGSNTIKFSTGINNADLDSIDVFKNKKYEAENATLNNVQTVYHVSASNNFKVGYIDFADSYVQFNVNVPTSGTYNLVVKYGNGWSSNSTHNVSVNGGASKPITYLPHGWDRWHWANMDVSLSAGNNTIKFTKGTNYAELDTIEVFPLANVKDRSFEGQVTNTISAPWAGNGTGDKGIDRGLGYAHTGANNAWIRTTSGWNSIYQTVAVTPNTNYRLTGWVRNSNNFTGGWFGVRTPDNSGAIAEINYGGLPQYTKLTVDFDSGSYTSVRVYVGYEAPGSDSWIQVDDISIKKR
jgi:GH43 family beta-xylosidase